ncbi:F-box domain-containing protein [Brazilian cedratvirus IHUMI]|uniref:F-box domain-containing protein n=1 Tax=Brazilian cedratvirus IHUMI TaxID=2126980 RepID=A0A2R8FF61_9VIRU|nr:F-box domain-containing protein [Brazilian cedratvirus IHUMI]
MQGLPVELQEEVLFSLKEPEDLYRACSSSRQNRAICSASVFWREKFRRENLPLLEEGDSFRRWLDIYVKSLRVAEMADQEIAHPQGINLALVPDLSLLPGLENVLEKEWLEVRSGKNVYSRITKPARRARGQEKEISVFTNNYFIFLLPEDSTYRYQVIYEGFTSKNGVKGPTLKTLSYQVKVALNQEQVWNILYHLFYYMD